MRNIKNIDEKSDFIAWPLADMTTAASLKSGKFVCEMKIALWLLPEEQSYLMMTLVWSGEL